MLAQDIIWGFRASGTGLKSYGIISIPLKIKLTKLNKFFLYFCRQNDINSELCLL